MTLRLYLEDSAVRYELRRLLVADGHEVVLPAAVGLAGARDPDHFAYARRQGLVLVTMNPSHFRALHDQEPDHAGIFAIYHDNDPTRDMTNAEIARAVRNLLEADVPIAEELHVLNHWRY